jgi:SAM-dependent methyltransferase
VFLVPSKSYEGSDLEALAVMPNYHGWIMNWFGPHVRGHVVEYGAGTGTFSQYLRPLAKSLSLIEPSVNLHYALQQKFRNDPLVELGTMTLEEHVKQTGSDSVDRVVLVNVLEHIEDDAWALSELSRVVSPGGCILIFVPALMFLMSRLDTLLGHFRRYHLAELKEKLRRADIDIVSCGYFDLPGVVPWFLVNRVLGSSSFNPALVRLYDRAIVPIARGAEALIRPPFGKNLIAIGRCTGTRSN